MSFQNAVDQDCKEMDDAPYLDTLPRSDEDMEWSATPQDDNSCLTFKRMLPRLGPKPPPAGA